MTPSDYQVEKTAIGMQYVIPGAERIVKPKRRVFNADGDRHSGSGGIARNVAEVTTASRETGPSAFDVKAAPPSGPFSRPCYRVHGFFPA